MSPRAGWARVGLVAGAVLALDQLTKALVRAELRFGEVRDAGVPILDIVHVRNRGIAFGLADGATTIVIVVVAAAVLALVAFFVTRAGHPRTWLPVGLLLGGAIGNLIDRVARGYVTDFLKVPAWPAFNVADIAITFGVIVLVLVVDRDAAVRRR